MAQSCDFNYRNQNRVGCRIALRVSAARLIEGHLFATLGLSLDRSLGRPFASVFLAAIGLRFGKHEELIAGDAAAPEKGERHQRRKYGTEEGSVHGDPLSQ